MFQNGRAEGIKEGTKLGLAQGLAQGIKEGKESAARETASLKATNEALHNRLAQVLEQSNGIATGQLVATQTATELLVENHQLKNQVAHLERTIADHKVELTTLKEKHGEQAKELTVLRNSSAHYLGLTGSGHQPVLGAVRSASASAEPRPGSSPYFRRP